MATEKYTTMNENGKINAHDFQVLIAAEKKKIRDFARTPEGRMKKVANRQKQAFAAERRGQSPKVKGFNPRRGGFADYDD